MTENDKDYIRQFQNYLYGISLKDASVPRIVPDGIYGKKTKAAVSAYQRTRGLKATGDADIKTWQTVKDEYERIISEYSEPAPLCVFPGYGYAVKVGDTGDIPAFIQIILRCLSGEYGFTAAENITGAYSQKDAEEIKILQNIHGLDKTGEVDIFTWNCICSDYNMFCSFCEYNNR